MPVECKYCGEEVSLLGLLWTRFTKGHYPECPGCGADDNTLEVQVDQSQ